MYMFFIKSAIKKDIFNIKLMNWSLGDNKREDDTNNSSLDNKTGGISGVKIKYYWSH